MKRIYYLFVLLLFFGCEQDALNPSVDNHINLSPVEVVQNNFSWESFSDSLGLMKGNLMVQWQNYEVHAFESVDWYEFKMNRQVGYQSENGIGGRENFTLLAFVDQKGVPHYRLSRFVSYTDDDNLQPGYFAFSNFTGINYLYDMKGQLALMRFIRDGEDVSTVVDIAESIDGLPVIPQQCMQKAPIGGAGCTDSLDCMLTFNRQGGGSSGGCGGGGGGWVSLTTSYYTDWYMNRSNGTWEYQNTQYDGSSTEWVWVERSGFGGTNGSYDKDAYRYGESDYSGSIIRYLKDRPTEKPDYQLIVDKKQMREEHPCVFDALMGLTRFVNDPLKPEIFQEATFVDLLNLPDFEQPATLTEFILSVFNASREYDYVIQVGDIGDRNAITTQKKTAIKTTYITTVSEIYAKKATRLSIARTLIHESLHAYFLNIGYPGSDFLTNLNNIAIEKGFITEENNLNRAHHEFMVGYVTAMAASLKRWDTANGSGGTLGDDYYTAMAFGGLFVWDTTKNQFNFETDAFKSLISNENDRLFIKDIVINESEGNENAKGQKCSE
ncbi:MAG: hypothetical protein RQ735_08275 [Flavobacteriaceae bacterium]|nr:hypothetical protein [Flavobacteriaceae bacterium]